MARLRIVMPTRPMSRRADEAHEPRRLVMPKLPKLMRPMRPMSHKRLRRLIWPTRPLMPLKPPRPTRLMWPISPAMLAMLTRPRPMKPTKLRPIHEADVKAGAIVTKEIEANMINEIIAADEAIVINEVFAVNEAILDCMSV